MWGFPTEESSGKGVAATGTDTEITGKPKRPERQVLQVGQVSGQTPRVTS